jgi:hypothetical protein
LHKRLKNVKQADSKELDTIFVSSPIFVPADGFEPALDLLIPFELPFFPFSFESLSVAEAARLSDVVSFMHIDTTFSK